MASSKWKNKFDWEQIKNDIQKEKDSKTKSFKDDRIFKPDWKAAVEKNKFYTLRFLPDQDGNPYVHYYTHYFEYPNADGTGKKWYINNCISTFGWDPKCPICAKNSEYYNSAFESDKALARAYKRNQHWVSNILIVNDPINPENNGKVFLYKYGFKIYQKIESQMFPSETDLADEDFEQFVPFDLFNGANFKLKIKMQGEFPNYDDSSWARPKAIFDSDDEIDEIMEKTYSLNEFIDPKNYPTVEDTIKQVGHILGIVPTVNEQEEVDEDEDNSNATEDDHQAETEAVESADSETEDFTDEESVESDIDDDEEFFKNLQK